jgi:DNA-binding CsgD family transcriptional regulator
MIYGEIKQKILNLRNQGLSYKEIEKRLKCSKGTISFHCQKLLNNEDIIKTNEMIVNKNRISNIISSLDDTTKQTVIELHKFGINTPEIADLMHIDLPSIRKLCKNIERTFFVKITNYDKVKHRRRKLKLLAVLYKGGKCAHCGYNKNFDVIDFHHLNPEEKDFCISSKCNSRWKTIKKELDKCIALCANCHRETHSTGTFIFQIGMVGVGPTTFPLSAEGSAI